MVTTTLQAPAANGHLFITRGNLLHLACDAVLVPSGTHLGRRGHITAGWRSGVPNRNGFVTVHPEPPRRVARVSAATASDPAIWLGHTGETGNESPKWFCKAIEEFVLAAAEDPVHPGRARPMGDPRPLLAIPLVGIGAGGMADRKGRLVVMVIERLLARLTEIEADVVLVVPGANEYAACQQARATVLGDDWPDLDPSHRSEVSRLADEARTDRLVLFMGAGTGLGAGLPDWKTLLQGLGKAAKLSPAELEELGRLDPRDAGAALQHRLGDGLHREIARLVSSSRSSLLHQLLASLPVTQAVTTNYDTLFEQAWRDAGHESFGVLPHRPGRTKHPWLLKLHGSVEDPTNVVLSRGDYLRLEGRGAALAGIVQAMLLTRHMLFVGYSLSDDNFHRIAHQVCSALDSAVELPGELREFGTALTPDRMGLGSDLWAGQVRFISTASASGAADAGHAARRVAIVVDRLGAESSAHMAHLLDSSYRAVFSPRELHLRKLLEKAHQVAQSDDVRPALGRAVLDALASLDGRPVRS